MRQGNRVKSIEFEGHGVACPQLTSLIYSAGQKLEIIMPSFAFAGFRTFTVAGGKHIEFFNDDCRYVVTARKFLRTMGREEEVDPLANSSPPRSIPRRPILEPGSDGPMSAGRDKSVKDNYHHGDGFVQFRFSSDAPSLRTQFAGLLFFSPRAMTIYLVNASSDLQVHSSKDRDSKSYDIDISDADSRTRLSVKKEIHQNGTWNSAFGK